MFDKLDKKEKWDYVLYNENILKNMIYVLVFDPKKFKHILFHMRSLAT